MVSSTAISEDTCLQDGCRDGHNIGGVSWGVAWADDQKSCWLADLVTISKDLDESTSFLNAAEEHSSVHLAVRHDRRLRWGSTDSN